MKGRGPGGPPVLPGGAHPVGASPHGPGRGRRGITPLPVPGSGHRPLRDRSVSGPTWTPILPPCRAVWIHRVPVRSRLGHSRAVRPDTVSRLGKREDTLPQEAACIPVLAPRQRLGCRRVSLASGCAPAWGCNNARIWACLNGPADSPPHAEEGRGRPHPVRVACNRASLPPRERDGPAGGHPCLLTTAASAVTWCVPG